MIRYATTLIVLLAGVPTLAQEGDDIAFGRQLAEQNCAQCHAIGRDDESRHPEALAFRTLSERYPVESLQEALAEGISVGHEDMPQFRATPEQIVPLLAYLESIQDDQNRP